VVDGLFFQILKALWAVHPQRFWLIWITTTAAAVIYVMSVVGQVATSRSQKPILTRRQVGTPSAVVALMLLAMFLTSYIAMTLVWEDFVHYDNDLLILSVLKGSNIPPPIWRDNGRFFPLGMQEFNLIRHFTNTPIGYHLLPIVQVLIFFCMLLVLDDELSITARAGLAMLVLLTPTLFLSFDGLIWEERNVLFFLTCLMLSVKQFERTKAVLWAVAAVVCAQIMLYYKEIGFLLLLCFAAVRLISRCRNGQHGRWDYKRLWDRESRLDLCLASLAVLFLLSYFAVMGIHVNTTYAHAHRHPMAELVLHYVWLDLLVWLFMCFVVRRTYLVLRDRTAPWMLWDALAFGGVAWFFAYLYLSMYSAYYLAPVDLIAVLYVGRFVLLSWKNTRSWSKVAALTLAFAVVLQDVSMSTFAAFERKNVIHARVEIASLIAARYRNGIVPNLFFPFAGPYSIMEFVVYLNYRGVPINSVAFARGATVKDARCMEYRSIRCHPASQPAPGDLVIVLPDDEASPAEASVYRERGSQLFYYEPRPPIPHRLYRLGASFPGDYNITRSDRWMDASVTVWK
jgi:hypothetical protein